MMKAWSMPSGTRESISFRLGFTGTILPAYPCFLRKRCGRAVFFFSSPEAPMSATAPGANSACARRARVLLPAATGVREACAPALRPAPAGELHVFGLQRAVAQRGVRVADARRLQQLLA